MNQLSSSTERCAVSSSFSSVTKMNAAFRTITEKDG